MSILLELTPEEETTLRSAAEAKGQDVSAFLKSLAIATARKSSLQQRWNAAGEAATQEARTRLHDKGIGVVYEKNGSIVEELPNGSIRVLEEAV